MRRSDDDPPAAMLALGVVGLLVEGDGLVMGGETGRLLATAGTWVVLVGSMVFFARLLSWWGRRG